MTCDRRLTTGISKPGTRPCVFYLIAFLILVVSAATAVAALAVESELPPSTADAAEQETSQQTPSGRAPGIITILVAIGSALLAARVFTWLSQRKRDSLRIAALLDSASDEIVFQKREITDLTEEVNRVLDAFTRGNDPIPPCYEFSTDALMRLRLEIATVPGNRELARDLGDCRYNLSLVNRMLKRRTALRRSEPLETEAAGWRQLKETVDSTLRCLNKVSNRLRDASDTG